MLASSVIANNLKEWMPESEIHFFCYKPAQAVLQGNPNVDRIILFDDAELKKYAVLKKFAQMIRDENYDVLIDPYAKIQSRYITWFSGAKQRISFDKPVFKHLYTNVVPQADTTLLGYCKALEDRLKLLSPLGIDVRNLEYKFRIFLSEEEKTEGKNILRKAGIDFSRPVLMLGILGSSPSKSWSLDRMAQLIVHLQEQYDADILFNYMPSQREAVQQILGQLPSQRHVYPEVIGENVREFLKIMSACNAYIGNEGGGINMSKGLDKPTFSIYSPHKFPEIWGCMENLPEHDSVHLREIRPDLYVNPDLDKYLEKASDYYEMIPLEFVQQKLDSFMRHNFPGTNQESKASPSVKSGISALLITKNEEENIAAYLTEVSKYADEIIIVDSFSTDRTVELAQRNPKVTVYQREFDNFSSQRNYALSKASNDWVTFFDADERLPQPLIAEILEKVKNPGKISSYYIYRRFYVQNSRLKYSGWQNDKAIRLFKRTCCRYKDEFLVHEILDCKGETGKLKNKLNHYSFKTFGDYRDKLYFYSKLRAQELYRKKTKPNFFHYYIKPGFRFFHHYLFRFGFLDGYAGFRMADLLARYVHKRYEFLDELWNQSETKR